MIFKSQHNRVINGDQLILRFSAGCLPRGISELCGVLFGCPEDRDPVTWRWDSLPTPATYLELRGWLRLSQASLKFLYEHAGLLSSKKNTDVPGRHLHRSRGNGSCFVWKLTKNCARLGAQEPGCNWAETVQGPGIWANPDRTPLYKFLFFLALL